MQGSKSVIGIYKARSERNIEHLIYVCQKIEVNRKKVITAVSKSYTLDSVDGEKIINTDNLNTIFLKDGRKLRVIEKLK